MNEYNFSNNSLSRDRLSLSAGTSQVSSSQAIFGYLKRERSSSSSDGSSVIRVTNSSRILRWHKLKYFILFF